MTDFQLVELLCQARTALINPVDGDGLRTWRNVDAVEAIDHALKQLTAKTAPAGTEAA
jgi:hypothetical protein